MSDREVKEQFLLNLEYWHKWKDLHYVDWEKNTREAIQHNLRVVAYRTDVAAKVAITWQDRQQSLIREIRKVQATQDKSLDLVPEIYKIQKTQRQKLIDLERQISDLKAEVRGLKDHTIRHKAITREDINTLVVDITEQPKAIEQRTVQLAEELKVEVQHLKALIRAVEGRLMA